MKKRNINLILILTFLIFVLIKPVSADLKPMDSHKLEKCVKFTNLDNFPNIVLIGYISTRDPLQNKGYRVENNQCLTKGYKHNTLYIMWTTKDKFKKIGDLKNLESETKKILSGNALPTNTLAGRERDEINVKIPKKFNLLLTDVQCSNEYTSNPFSTDRILQKKIIHYSIDKSPLGRIFAYKSKTINKYNRGSDKIMPHKKPFNNSEWVDFNPSTKQALKKKKEFLNDQIESLKEEVSEIDDVKKMANLISEVDKKRFEKLILSKDIEYIENQTEKHTNNEKFEEDEDDDNQQETKESNNSENQALEKHKKSEEFEEKEKVKKDKEEENQQAKKQETKKPDSSENNNKEDSEKEINKQKQTSVFQLKALWQGIKNIFKQIFAIYK